MKKHVSVKELRDLVYSKYLFEDLQRITSELPHAAQDVFAGILDYVRDCMDVADEASRREMLSYGDKLDVMIAELRVTGFCVCMAERQARIVSKSWKDQTPMALDVVYLIAAPIESSPTRIAVSRKLSQ